MNVKILPSLLAADIGNLEAAVRRAESAGADGLHLDIMDGVFVPNVSMGPAVVEMARRCTGIPLSVHLMMIRPDQYVAQFIDAGADSLLIHIETQCDVADTLAYIRDRNVRPGIALNPGTPAEHADPFLMAADEVICMTVEPGHGGQSFMSNVLPKIEAIRNASLKAGKPEMDILVDGGIDRNTGADCVRRGANVLVAGTSLYGAEDMSAEVHALRDSALAASA
jgi:ribulose-phosphate 3-epimerase